MLLRMGTWVDMARVPIFLLTARPVAPQLHVCLARVDQILFYTI